MQSPYPKSKICKIAWYLENIRKMPDYSGKELHDYANEARDWYNDNIPEEILASRAKVISTGGFTEEQWAEVLNQARSIFFLPTAEMNAVNKGMQKLMEPWVINSAPYLPNYTYDLVKWAAQRRKLIRIPGTKPYRYHLPKPQQ